MWKVSVFFLLSIPSVVSKSCHFESNGTCTTKITLYFPEKDIEELSPVKLWYEQSNGTRVAAPSLDCDIDNGHWDCSRAVGYSYSQPSDGMFYVYLNSSGKCVISWTFAFEFRNSEDVRCTFNQTVRKTTDEGNGERSAKYSAEVGQRSTRVLATALTTVFMMTVGGVVYLVA